MPLPHRRVGGVGGRCAARDSRPWRKTTFAEIAAQYWEAKAPRLRTSTKKEYRSTLDRLLLPKFKDRKIGSITVDDVAELLRDLSAKGLKRSTIQDVPDPAAWRDGVRRPQEADRGQSLRPADRGRPAAHSRRGAAGTARVDGLGDEGARGCGRGVGSAAAGSIRLLRTAAHGARDRPAAVRTARAQVVRHRPHRG